MVLKVSSLLDADKEEDAPYDDDAAVPKVPQECRGRILHLDGRGQSSPGQVAAALTCQG